MLPKVDNRPSAQALLASIKAQLSTLEKLLAECNAEWGVDDAVYASITRALKFIWLKA
jgi:hypothetical protein